MKKVKSNPRTHDLYFAMLKSHPPAAQVCFGQRYNKTFRVLGKVVFNKDFTVAFVPEDFSPIKAEHVREISRYMKENGTLNRDSKAKSKPKKKDRVPFSSNLEAAVKPKKKYVEKRSDKQLAIDEGIYKD